MPQTFERFVRSAWAAARIADAVDIFLIAAVIYWLMVWLRTRFRVLVGGLALLGLTYAAARVWEMYLTLILLRAFAAVALVGALVVFHKELRRAVEQLAVALRLRQWSAAGPTDPVVDILVTALWELSEQRIGALVVLAGHEPLDRHSSHGISIQAKLSNALLHSLFDPHSAGHDGAIIVRGDRAAFFGVHLPLSESGGTHPGLGTRHAAALGLSEQCDAMVIVVSEERGTVSVAQTGQLREVSSPQRLGELIVAFRKRLERPVSQRWSARAIGHRLRLAATSVAIALVLWGVHWGYQSNTAIRSIDAPIIVANVPAGWKLDEPQPSVVTVSVSGPSGSIGELDERDVTVTIDAKAVALEGGAQSVTISGADVSVGQAFTVVGLEPKTVRLKVSRMFEASLSVVPDVRGSLPAGFALSRVQVTPDTVTGMVNEANRQGLSRVKTRPIDLTAITSSTTLSRQLIIPRGFELSEQMPNVVSVEVVVVEPAAAGLDAVVAPEAYGLPPPDGDEPAEPARDDSAGGRGGVFPGSDRAHSSPLR